jgi:hypothetical protein
LTGNVHIVDHENIGSNEVGDHAVNEACTVSAAAPVDSHIFWTRCTGGEVVVNLKVTCTLVGADVSVKVTSELREAGGCDPNQELEDDETKTVTVLASGGTQPVNFDLTHECTFGNCGDHAEVRLNTGVGQRVCMTP